MPTIITHPFIPATLYSFFPASMRSTRLLTTAMICSIFPDIDVLAFSYGIPYQDLFGHRGLTHSLFFACLLAFICTVSIFRKEKTGRKITAFLFLFLATASHGIFDAMTNGGLGVALLAPFDQSRYFLPWRPLIVSPIGLKNFLSNRGAQVLISEFVWILLPCSLLMLLRYVTRAMK